MANANNASNDWNPTFGQSPSILPGPPIVDIALDRVLRKGIAQQMRALADVLDPPEVS